MRKRHLGLLLIAFLLVGGQMALAQTPTATVPTSTPTSAPTATKTHVPYRPEARRKPEAGQVTVTASATSTGVFGAWRPCDYVLLVAAAGNAGPVHWSYGSAATTNSAPLAAGATITITTKSGGDGNQVRVIQGTGCSANCVVYATCQ